MACAIFFQCSQAPRKNPAGGGEAGKVPAAPSEVAAVARTFVFIGASYMANLGAYLKAFQRATAVVGYLNAWRRASSRTDPVTPPLRALTLHAQADIATPACAPSTRACSPRSFSHGRGAAAAAPPR